MGTTKFRQPYTKVLPKLTAGLLTIRTDVGGFGSSGRGLMPIPAEAPLHKGDFFAVTEEDADTMRATVLSEPSDGVAEVEINWDDVLEYA